MGKKVLSEREVWGGVNRGWRIDVDKEEEGRKKLRSEGRKGG